MRNGIGKIVIAVLLLSMGIFHAPGMKTDAAERGDPSGWVSNVINLMNLSITLPEPEPLWKEPMRIVYPKKTVVIDSSKPIIKDANRVEYTPVVDWHKQEYSAFVLHSVERVWIKPGISTRAEATVGGIKLDPNHRLGVEFPLTSGMNSIDIVIVNRENPKEERTYTVDIQRGFEPKRNAIAGGDTDSLLIDSKNRLITWGARSRSPRVEKMAGPVSVDMKSTHALVLDGQGAVWGVGLNSYGQLGSPGTAFKQLQKLAVPSGNKAIAAGFRHSLLLTREGRLKGFGDNKYGQLSTNAIPGSKTPVSAFLTDVTDLAAGDVHSLAINKAGWLWSFGSNRHGVLGDGTITSSNIPVLVADIDQVYAAEAGDNHSVALRKDGTVWTWGFNDFGQRGDGITTSDRLRPSKVFSNAVDIAAGKHHTVVLKADGTVWIWGSYDTVAKDDLGRIYRKPIQIQGLTDVIAIGAGSMHAIAMKKDGTVWVWGSNANGQLGITKKGITLQPIQMKY